MSKITDLLKDIAQSGPDNLKRLLVLAERMPSDETLKSLNTTINNLIPYIPQLEKIFGDSNIKNLERLTRKIPDQRTLDRLVNAIPILEKMPDKKTLSQLLDKASSLESFLNSLEKSN